MCSLLRKNGFFALVCFVRDSCFIYVVCIYLLMMMFVSFKIIMTGDTSGVGTAHSSLPPEFNTGFQWDSYSSLFNFRCSVLSSIACLYHFLLLDIVLSVLLRFTPFLYLQTFVNERMIVVEQHVKIVSRYIMARTSYCLIRWWCTGPTHWVGLLLVSTH